MSHNRCTKHPEYLLRDQLIDPAQRPPRRVGPELVKRPPAAAMRQPSAPPAHRRAPSPRLSAHRPGQACELASRNAALRRERDHLASQLEAALGHLRRLTIDNAELRRELQTALAITRIGTPDKASHR